MMVFLALPALQRSQRDTQRKNDLSRVMTAIANYSAANRGNLPTAAWTNVNWQTRFVNLYLSSNGDQFLDPAGNATAGDGVSVAVAPLPPTYVINQNVDAVALPAADQVFNPTVNQNAIYPTLGAVCDIAAANAGNGGQVTLLQGSRKIAFRMPLEGGGVYCLSN